MDSITFNKTNIFKIKYKAYFILQTQNRWNFQLFFTLNKKKEEEKQQ